MAIATTLRKFSIAAAGAVLTTLAVSESARAGTMFFTDFDAFNAITQTSLVEDFEAISPKNKPLPLFVSNNNTYAPVVGGPVTNVWVSTPGYLNYGVPVTSSSILTANGDEDFTVDFGTPTEAVGFDTYINAFGPATIDVFGASGLLDTFVLNHDPTTVGFLGILASEDITSIRWDTVNGRRINTGIDNIVQGTSRDTKPVPEPTSVLGLLTFGALGAASRLRKGKS